MSETAKIILGSVGAAGVLFGAIVGFAFWAVERKIEKRDDARTEKERNQNKFLTALLKQSSASIALSEATARAVQRIPDANCNGDMHEALSYAQSVKHELKDFMFSQGVQNIND